MSNYRFYNSKNKVIAVSTYAGKPVRGVAKCDPEDTFAIEYGEALAAARCNEKIAEKRVSRARRKMDEAQEAYMIAKRYYERMSKYYEDAVANLDVARVYVDDVLNDVAP
jgi:hypothetical protein